MSEHVLPPLLTEAEREACKAGAQALCDDWNTRYQGSREYFDKHAAALRALADRKAGSEYAAPGGSLASRKPREVLVVDDAPYNRDLSPADVSSAGVCETCGGKRRVQLIGNWGPLGESVRIIDCPDCTGRVAASDAKETT